MESLKNLNKVKSKSLLDNNMNMNVNISNLGQINSFVNSLNGSSSEISSLKGHLKRQVDCVIDLDKTYLEKRRKCLHNMISEFKKEDFDRFPEFVHPNGNQLMKLYDINFLNINQISDTKLDDHKRLPDSSDPADYSNLIELRTSILNSLINNINSLNGTSHNINFLNSFSSSNGNSNDLNLNNELNSSNLNSSNLNSGNLSSSNLNSSNFNNGLDNLNNLNCDLNNFSNFNNFANYNDFNAINSLNNQIQKTPQIKIKKKRGRTKLSSTSQNGQKHESKSKSKNKFLKAVNLTSKNSLLDYSNCSVSNLNETRPLNLSGKSLDKKSRSQSDLASVPSSSKRNHNYQNKTINDLIEYIPIDNLDEDGFLKYDKLNVKKGPVAFYNNGKRILCPNCPYVSTTNFVYHSTCHKLDYDAEKEVQCSYCNWTVQKSRNFTTLMSKHFQKHFVGLLMIDQGLNSKHLSEETKSKEWYTNIMAYQSKIKKVDGSSNLGSNASNQMYVLTELATYLNYITEKAARRSSLVNLSQNDLIWNAGLNGSNNSEQDNDNLQKFRDVDLNNSEKATEIIVKNEDNKMDNKDKMDGKREDFEINKEEDTNLLDSYHNLKLYFKKVDNDPQNPLTTGSLTYQNEMSVILNNKDESAYSESTTKNHPDLICIDSDEDKDNLFNSIF